MITPSNPCHHSGHRRHGCSMFTCGSRCCGIVVVVQSLTTSRSSSSSPLFRQGSWLSLRSSSCRRHLVFRRRRCRKVRALLLLWGSCSVGLALVRRGQEGQKPARDRNKAHAPVELSGSEPDLAAICTRPCIIVAVVHPWIVVAIVCLW